MKRKIIIILTVLILSIISWQIYNLINNRDKIDVKVVIAPADATITINNQSYRQKNIKLHANQTYQVKITRDGFKESHFTLKTVPKTQFAIDNTIYSRLEPLTEQAKKLKEQRIQDYQQVEGLLEADVSQQVDARAKNFPIIKHLPLVEYNYHIGYYQEGEELIISIYSDYHNFIHALNHLQLLDKDLSNYRIEFYDRQTKQKINNFFEEYLKHE
jgi:hypothetical protein